MTAWEHPDRVQDATSVRRQLSQFFCKNNCTEVLRDVKGTTARKELQIETAGMIVLFGASPRLKCF